MTLAELLVGTAITTTVVGVVLAATAPAERSFAVQQEMADLQQRLRVTVDAIATDLRSAGLVVPYRAGRHGDGAASGVFYRPDILGILFERPEAHARGGVPSGISHTYFVADGDGDGRQVMRYDGLETTMPLADNVVHLDFEYFGDSQPPQPLEDDGTHAEPPVTYGPSPPRLGADDPTDSWSAGENCTMAVVSGAHAPRLDVLAPDGIVTLAPAQLTDGPWCPDAAHPRRFDADLLRVRRVRVRVRMQPTAQFRATEAGGRAAGERAIDDQEIVIDIAPRNLQGDR